MKTYENLEQARNDIDIIDRKILELLKERFEIVDWVGEYKKQNNIAPLQPQRWKQLMEEKLQIAEEFWLDKEMVKDIWNRIHKAALDDESKKLNLWDRKLP